MRLTYRTARVLDGVARNPGASNRVIGEAADTGQGKEVTYSRFETIPDAPISSFELRLPEGPFSALAATTPLCGHTVSVKQGRRKVRRHVAANLSMPTTITAQDGAVVKQTTKIAVSGCATAKAKAKRAKSSVKPRR